MADDAATVEQLRAELAASRAREAALIEEVGQRNRELGEALEQQTATSEILRVIATSAADAQPVLDAVAGSAMRLSDSVSAVLNIREGDNLRFVAYHGPP